MLIRVRFFGDLREYLKKRWMTIEIPQNSSVYDFIHELAKNTESNLLEKLLEKDILSSEFRILVNGRNIIHIKGLDTELKDRDLISIMPVAGGG